MALVKCRECGAQVSTQASACPSCGKPVPKATSFLTWLLLGTICFFVIKACVSDPAPNTASSARKCDATMAHIMAGNFVKRQLKAPATAKFPYTSDPLVTVSPLGDCRFSVVSYVDSQNGFGALIRSRFSATMQASPDGKTWNAYDLVIE